MRRVVVAVAVVLCGAADAGVYKWVDENGKVQYGDAPPAASKADRIRTGGDAESVDMRWYDVTGTDSKAMWRSIAANGPKSDDGKVFAGRTDWNLTYRYRTRIFDGQCKVTEVTPRLAVVMQMPRWQDEGRAAVELRERWRRYVLALREHENGHRAHGVAATAEVQARIGALPARPDCNGFETQARSVADEIIATYAQRDREYDRRTGHGLTQGARFP
jgi:predicted secreted Zn-dependent protease